MCTVEGTCLLMLEISTGARTRFGRWEQCAGKGTQAGVFWCTGQDQQWTSWHLLFLFFQLGRSSHLATFQGNSHHCHQNAVWANCRALICPSLCSPSSHPSKAAGSQFLLHLMLGWGNMKGNDTWILQSGKEARNRKGTNLQVSASGHSQGRFSKLQDEWKCTSSLGN